MADYSKCSITIFYERHDRAITADIITQLLPTFSRIGYKNFCVEEPMTWDMSTSITYQRGKVKYYKQVEKIKSVDDPLVDSMLRSNRFAGAGKSHPEFLSSFKTVCENEVKVARSSVKLLTNLSLNKIKYQAIDPQGSVAQRLDINTRNLQMKKEIEKYCIDGDVIALVGVGHSEITSLLMSNPHNDIKSYHLVERLDDIGDMNNLDNKIQVMATFILGVDIVNLIKQDLIKMHEEL